jgi:hypothetical protein
VASVGPIEVHFPLSWRVLDRAPAIRGLTLREPLSLAAPGGATAPRIVTGVAPPDGPGLLPGAFRAALGSAQAVHLGRLEALRYDVTNAGAAGGVRRVYAAPISGGIATIVCVGPAKQPPAVCDEVAGSLRLHGATAFPVGPDRAYAAAVTGATSGVAAARARAARAFASARTAAAEASVSRALATAYSSAAQALARQAAPPQVASVHARITSALMHAASSYSRVANAATSKSAGGYRAASRAARAQAAAVDAAVLSLRRFGYKVG